VFEGAPRPVLSEKLETLKRQRPDEWYGLFLVAESGTGHGGLAGASFIRDALFM